MTTGPPDRVPPGSAPDGLVFLIYAGDELLDEGVVGPSGDPSPEVLVSRLDALAAGRGPAGGPVALRIYDGNTGVLLRVWSASTHERTLR